MQNEFLKTLKMNFSSNSSNEVVSSDDIDAVDLNLVFTPKSHQIIVISPILHNR